jgi:hypothetical protein
MVVSKSEGPWRARQVRRNIVGQMRRVERREGLRLKEAAACNALSYPPSAIARSRTNACVVAYAAPPCRSKRACSAKVGSGRLDLRTVTTEGL